MTVLRDVAAEIQRLAHAEGWVVGTIASELCVHHDVVERVLDAEHAVVKERPPRASKLDRYKPFVLRVLEKHPRLRATRIFHMLRKRGYRGSAKTVRRYVATVRPRRRRNQPVPLPLPLPAHVVDGDVQTHDLAGYDPAGSEAP